MKENEKEKDQLREFSPSLVKKKIERELKLKRQQYYDTIKIGI